MQAENIMHLVVKSEHSMLIVSKLVKVWTSTRIYERRIDKGLN